MKLDDSGIKYTPHTRECRVAHKFFKDAGVNLGSISSPEGVLVLFLRQVEIMAFDYPGRDKLLKVTGGGAAKWPGMREHQTSCRMRQC